MQTRSGTATVVNPQAAIVQAQNAQRIARRRAAATLAASVARTGRAGLRRGPRKVVGGRFETIQKVPTARKPKQQTFGKKDLQRFLSAFKFDPTKQLLAESRSSVFLPVGRTDPRTIQELRARTRKRTSTVIQPGLAGNFSVRTQSTLASRTAESFNIGTGPFGGIRQGFGGAGLRFGR